MTLKTRPFDPAAYLKTDTARAAYMNEALETGDPAFIADAVGVLARARGMGKVAKEAGLSRESQTADPRIPEEMRSCFLLKSSPTNIGSNHTPVALLRTSR